MSSMQLMRHSGLENADGVVVGAQPSPSLLLRRTEIQYKSERIGTLLEK